MGTKPIPMSLYQKQVQPRDYRRWTSNGDFGNIQPARLSAMMQSAERGNTADWARFCAYMLERDPDLESTLSTLKSRVSASKYIIVPSRGPIDRGGEYAEGAARMIGDMVRGMEEWPFRLNSILDAEFAGASFHQLVWDRRGGINVVSDLEWVEYERFGWDDSWYPRLTDGGSRHSAKDGHGEELMPHLWLVHISRTRAARPGKAGLARVIAWIWLFKKWCGAFYITALEKHGQPFITGEVPRNAPAATRDQFLIDLEQLSFDQVAVYEEGCKILFQGGPGGIGNGEAYARYIAQANEMIDKCILGATDLTNPGVHGSQSAVETRADEVLDPRTEALILSLGASIRRDVFRAVCWMNADQFGGRLPPVPEMIPVTMMPTMGVGTPEISAQPDQAVQPPDGEPAATQPQEQVADTALNGAQVQSLLTITQAAAAGQIPRQTAIETIMAAFPTFGRGRAEAMLADIGMGFTPAPKGGPALAAPAPSTPPSQDPDSAPPKPSSSAPGASAGSSAPPVKPRPSARANRPKAQARAGARASKRGKSQSVPTSSAANNPFTETLLRG